MNDAKKLALKHKIIGDFVFVEKIPGLNTHASDRDRKGLCEILQAEMGRELFVVHRLDKPTSGALCFALSSEAAARAAALFEARQVKKRYLFVTDQHRKDEQFSIQSKIDKRGDRFVSETLTKTPNSHTEFRLLKAMNNYDLWEAVPLTGKPHQIRLHAADGRIPILGDADHGGKRFPRLGLHSKEIEFSDRGALVRFESSSPVWVNDLTPELVRLFDLVQRRACLFDLSIAEDESLRWVHRESEKFRIDQFGPQLWISWYGNDEPSALELKSFEVLAKTFKKTGFIRRMQNRGKDPQAGMPGKIGAPRERWLAQENGLRYELRADTGQSPGLFLDQRENRWWLRTQAGGKSVLNLFSYTGGFSLNAAFGGASQVVTVDVSANFNNWARVNFQLNGLNDKDPRFEFWEQDAALFLKGCVKRGRRFDFIICDPPSFGRSQEGVFQIQKDLPSLVELCLECLAPGGRLLVSTNFEGWTREELRKQVTPFLRPGQIEMEEAPLQGLDFEMPEEEPLLKGVVIRRK